MRKQLSFINVVPFALVVLAMGMAPALWAAGTDTMSRDTGQPGAAVSQPSSVDRSQQLQDVEKASKLIGMSVQDLQGKKVGKIEDIVLDKDHSRIEYGVLSFGGLLGVGSKYFAIPWQSFQMQRSDGQTVLALDVSKQSLDKAPGFDKSHWPDFADETWNRQVHDFYGTQPGAMAPGSQPGERTGTVARAYDQATTGRTSAESAAPSRDSAMTTRDNTMGAQPSTEARTDESRTTASADRSQFWTRRLSEVIGLNAKDTHGENIGEIEDIAIEMKTGQVAFAILSLDSPRGKVAAVPWQAVQVQAKPKTAYIQTDKDTLRSLAFSENQMPNLSDRNYAQGLADRFGVQPYWSTYGYMGAGGQESGAAATGGDRQWYSSHYNAKNVKTVSGTVESVGAYETQTGMGQGVRLRVKLDDGSIATVYAGPQDYLSRQKVSFNNGDKISVTGSETDINGRNVILAKQISKGNDRVELLSDRGEPMWPQTMTPMKGDKSSPEMKGEKSSQDKTTNW